MQYYRNPIYKAVYLKDKNKIKKWNFCATSDLELLERYWEGKTEFIFGCWIETVPESGNANRGETEKQKQRRYFKRELNSN